MIKRSSFQSPLFMAGVLVTSLAVTAYSQGPAAQTTDSNPTAFTPAETETAKTQDDEITDADRIIRLETSIRADKQQIGQLESELSKTQAEEAAASAALQQLTNQIEDTKSQLQNAKNSGDQASTETLQSQLTELEVKEPLEKEQFDLVIRTRKSVQEQIATLRAKIAKDQESLDKLKGVSSPEPATVEPPTSTATSTPSAAAADSTKPSELPANADKETTEPTEEVVSKDVAKAREVVQEKAKSLRDIEQDLDSLADSKTLLEKSIQLESDKLESTRQKYDSLEDLLEVAEKEFSEKLASGSPATELQKLRTQTSDVQQRIRAARDEIRASTDRLQGLRNQLLALQAEETQLVKQSEELQRAVATAKRSEWVLKGRDYLYTTVPKVTVIVLLSLVLWMLLKVVCKRSRAWIARTGIGTSVERQSRADTLAGVFQNAGNMVIVIGSVLMILDASGVPIAALLGGAGVVGLAVAFGAQSLIKDFFCGFILLLENQYKVNDFVTIGGLSGIVERITLRVTVLRDFEGKVYFIPNGQISSVTNATRDWSRAVLEIGVGYQENVDDVIQELKQLTSQLREDPEYRDSILGDVEMLGVDNLGDSSVVIKFGVKTRPDKKWPVKRELLRRIKNTFDERGIEIPFPHRTVIHRTEDVNSAGPKEAAAITKSSNDA